MLSAFSGTFYSEWRAQQSEGWQHVPLWEREERIFNCENSCREKKTKDLLHLFKKSSR